MRGIPSHQSSQTGLGIEAGKIYADFTILERY